jgi:hypothetical protein
MTAVDTAVISARALNNTFGKLEAVKAIELGQWGPGFSAQESNDQADVPR